MSTHRELSVAPGEKGAGCVSKRGVDDGNQKGGGSPQPAQENQFHFIEKNALVKY